MPKMTFTDEELELVQEALMFVADNKKVGERFERYTGYDVDDLKAVLDRRFDLVVDDDLEE